MMTAAQQVEFFKGCVYDTKLNKIRLPDGTYVYKGPFGVIYGGKVFDIGDGRTTRSAWNAFLHNPLTQAPRC